MKKLLVGLLVLVPFLFTGCFFFYESATIKVVNNSDKDFYWIVDYNGSLREEKNDSYNVDAGESYTRTFDCEYLKGEIEDRGGDHIEFYYCDEQKLDKLIQDNSTWLYTPTERGMLKDTGKTGYPCKEKQNDGIISDYYIITIHNDYSVTITAK